MIEAISMNVERRCDITTQDAARSPVAISSRGQGVLIAGATDFDVFDQPNAVLSQSARTADGIVWWSDQRTDRPRVATIESDSAQRSYLSHRGKLHVLAASLHETEGLSSIEQEKTPHSLRRGLSYLRRPDMIIDVTMLGPAWHARPDPGEPGRVNRRSYSDGHLAGGTIAHATHLADDVLLRNCAVYLARHSQSLTGR
jgi:hypothetical protein